MTWPADCLPFLKHCIMNWTALILISGASLLFIIFLLVKNIRDGKAFKNQLNNDYHKTKEEENDIDAEEKMK